MNETWEEVRGSLRVAVYVVVIDLLGVGVAVWTLGWWVGWW